MLKSIKGTRLKWIGCCELTAAGNILACVRQWDSEVGSAVSLSWRLSSQIRSRMTQLSQVLQHRDWLQSTPGLAASDHTGTTGKGFLCSCEAIWHRELCAVEGAHAAGLTALTCDYTVMQRFVDCVHLCIGGGCRCLLLLTTVYCPYQVVSEESRKELVWGGGQ